MTRLRNLLAVLAHHLGYDVYPLTPTKPVMARIVVLTTSGPRSLRPLKDSHPKGARR